MRPKTPTRIGRYAIERLLGQGGMGRVWLARDTVLGRRVAIKVLRDDLALAPAARAELVDRMQHEARAAAAVSHPHIITLHDMGEDDAVGLFLVFEYVSGPRTDGPESLRDRLRDGALPLSDVAKLARELGSALSFAHAAGIVHRDIKPENVLFSRTGAKIADFGIARIPESTITRANAVLGTPAYTSPEALSSGDFGAASDQFAFAATLYEAATGVRAFEGDDPIATAGKVSSEPPPPLDPALGTAPVVRTLWAALNKGMAKGVEGRFASCVDLGEAVARAIERPDASDVLFDIAHTPIRTQLAFDIERPPLSSRINVGRTKRTSERPTPLLTPYGGETPIRPSIVIRKQTHRWQNLVASLALGVIVVLVVIGKKRHQRHIDAQDSAKATLSSVPPPAAQASVPPALPTVRKFPPRVRAPEPASSGRNDGGSPLSSADASVEHE